MERDDERREPPPLEARLREHARSFADAFGAGGGVRTFFSPGRVNLMGAHLDYNGGPVMPAAIDRGTFFALRARGDDRVRLASTVEEGGRELQLGDPIERSGRWVDYPLGVLRHLAEDRRPPHGFDLLVGGNLPIGAGLSSSASISVGTAYVLDALWELGLDAHARIRAALWAERSFVGVQCGIMDPFAVSLTRPGHLLWLDCKDQSTDHLPLDPERLTIAVADTGVRRELARGAFNERVEQCGRAFEILRRFRPAARCLGDLTPGDLEEHGDALGPVLRRRARHVIGEVERTWRARRALERGDLATFGGQMTAAHGSLREDFEVSIPELDHLVESAVAWEGVWGTRLTGAGFGGCIVIALHGDAHEGLAEHLDASYGRRFGRTASVEFFRASAGPREVVP